MGEREEREKRSCRRLLLLYLFSRCVSGKALAMYSRGLSYVEMVKHPGLSYVEMVQYPRRSFLDVVAIMRGLGMIRSDWWPIPVSATSLSCKKAQASTTRIAAVKIFRYWRTGFVELWNLMRTPTLLHVRSQERQLQTTTFPSTAVDDASAMSTNNGIIFREDRGRKETDLRLTWDLLRASTCPISSAEILHT